MVKVTTRGSITEHARFVLEVSRFRRIPKWLWDLREAKGFARAAVGGLLGPFVVFVAADWIGYCVPWTRPDRLTFAAWILECLGLLTVVIGAWRLERQLHPTPSPATLRGWLRGFPLIRRDVSLQVGDATTIELTGRVYVEVTRRPGTTTDERLETLERALRDLEARMLSLQKTTDAEFDAIKAKVKDEANARAAATQELSTGIDRTLDSLFVGGLHLEMMGVIWIFLGLTAATVPELLYYWFGCYYDMVTLPWLPAPQRT